MEPNHLKTRELSYELKIRSIDDSGDVEKKRKLLRGVLAQEDANRSFHSSPVAYPFSHEVDVREMKESIADLKKSVDSFSGSANDLAYKRITSRLNHLSGRLNRLRFDNDQEETQKKAIQLAILDLEGELAFKIIPTGAASSPIRTMPDQNFNASSSKYVAPYKWNLQFSGSKSESINSFLEKVDMLSEARGVSKPNLFSSACDLFKDEAWIWFLSNKSKFQNWDDLVKKLKDDFLPYNYEEELWREINNRTQGPSERVAIYISSMENLFNRLRDKPDELSRVNKIRRNLRPYYISRLALHEPQTVSELTNLCKKLEEARTWSDNYQEPSYNKNQLLEPELSSPFGAHSSKRSHFVRRDVNSNIASVSSTRCWNCKDIGHTFNNCNKPKTIFCYSCGLSNVIKSKCSRCQGKNQSKNEFRGGESLDVVTTVVTPSPETGPPPSRRANKGNRQAKRSQR